MIFTCCGLKDVTELHSSAMSIICLKQRVSVAWKYLSVCAGQLRCSVSQRLPRCVINGLEAMA